MDSKFEKNKAGEALHDDEKRNKQQRLNFDKLIKKWVRYDDIHEKGLKANIDLEYKKRRTKRSKTEHQQLVITQQKIKYNHQPQRIEEEKVLATRRFETFVNNSNQEKNFKLKLDARVMEKRTHTYAYGLKTGVIVGVMTPYGGGGLDLEQHFDFTREMDKEQEQTVEKEAQIICKENHRIVCRGELWMVPEVDEFSMDIILSGDVPLYFNHKVKYANGKFIKDKAGHKLQFIPIREIFKSLQDNNKLPTEVSFSIEADKVVCTLKGMYRVHSYDSELVVEKQTPIDINSIVPVDKSQSDTIASGNFYRYGPKFTATADDLTLPLEYVNQSTDERFCKVIDFMMAPATFQPEILKLIDEQCSGIRNAVPKPSETENRAVTVDYEIHLTGKRVVVPDFSDKSNTTSEKNRPSISQATESTSNLEKEKFKKLIVSLRKHNYQFELKRNNISELIISYKESNIKSRVGRGSTLEALIASLEASAKAAQINIKATELEEQEAIKLEGDEESIGYLLNLLEQVSGNNFPRNSSFFKPQLRKNQPEGEKETEEIVICALQ